MFAMSAPEFNKNFPLYVASPGLIKPKPRCAVNLSAPRKSNVFAIVTGDTSVNGILAPVEPFAVTNTLFGPEEMRSIAVCKHAGGYTVTLEAM